MLIAAGVYLTVGLCFGIWFVAFAVQRVDDAARDSGVTFRLLILPGAVALWPVLISKVTKL